MSMAGYGWHNRPAPPGSAELAAAVGDYCRVCIDLFGDKKLAVKKLMELRTHKIYKTAYPGAYVKFLKK